MTLRIKIQEAIDTAQGNRQNAAIAVCVLLENEVGLSGNGWFDGDDELSSALNLDAAADEGDDDY